MPLFDIYPLIIFLITFIIAKSSKKRSFCHCEINFGIYHKFERSSEKLKKVVIFSVFAQKKAGISPALFDLIESLFR